MNSLSSHIRWCMTGTPVQNGVGDIGSLVRFLRVPVMGDVANFWEHILDKTKLTSLESSSHDFDNLRLLLSSICLRRNTSVLQLPGVNTNADGRTSVRWKRRHIPSSLSLARKQLIGLISATQTNLLRFRKDLVWSLQTEYLNHFSGSVFSAIEG